MKKLGKLVTLFVILALAALIYFWISSQKPKTPDLSKAYEIQGAEHIQIGAPHPEYNSNPPSSGWHYAEPAKEEFYDKELSDEQVVHNLEHGDIWIAYNPRISQGMKDELKKLSKAKIITTARAKNEYDISLVAWGRVDSFNIENNALDIARIEDFIKRYRNKGPEKVLR